MYFLIKKRADCPTRASALACEKKLTARLNQRSEPLAAATAAETAGPGLVRPGTSFVDRGRPALEVPTVQGGDGLIGLVLVRHLNEAESAGLAARLVLDDGRAGDLAERRENVLEILLGRRTGNVSRRRCSYISPLKIALVLDADPPIRIP